MRAGPGRATVGVGPKVRAAPVYKQIMRVRRLLAPHIHLVVTPSWLVEGEDAEWIDNANDAAEKMVARAAHTTVDALRTPETKYHSVVPFLSTTAYKILHCGPSRPVTFQHELRDAKARRAAREAFSEVFGKRFTWDGTMRSVLTVKA